MAKKLFKKVFPNLNHVRDHKHLKIFGNLLHNPNLWQLNRYCVSTAFSVGLFVAFVPIPFQMVLAAAIAILLRANLPISVILVWITNPLTMPPFFYFAFKVGAYILHVPPRGFQFELSFAWLTNGMSAIWQPFLLGCLVCGLSFGLIANLVIRLIWRYHVRRDWLKRKLRRNR